MGNTLDWKRMKEKVDKTVGYIVPKTKGYIAPTTESTIKPTTQSTTKQKQYFEEGWKKEKIHDVVGNVKSKIHNFGENIKNAFAQAGESIKDSKADAKSENDIKIEGHEDAYELQKQYLEEYLGRGEFDYDINTDEMYKLYRQQALDTAEKLRRDTTAQAAGLTGGYGSTYAAAVGSEAAADYMHDFDAEIAPELYEAAYSRYKNEGADLLEKSDIAGALGDSLYQGSDEYNAILAALGEATGESEGGLSEADKKHLEHRIFDSGGWFDIGDSSMLEEIEEQVIENGMSYDEFYAFLVEKGQWEDTKEKMTSEEIAYLSSRAIETRVTQWKNSDGHSPLEYARNLYNSGAGNEAIIDKLYEYKSKDGKSLSDEDIAFIINNI